MVFEGNEGCSSDDGNMSHQKPGAFAVVPQALAFLFQGDHPRAELL
jgi:hypothetical protein